MEQKVQAECYEFSAFPLKMHRMTPHLIVDVSDCLPHFSCSHLVFFAGRYSIWNAQQISQHCIQQKCQVPSHISINAHRVARRTEKLSQIPLPQQNEMEKIQKDFRELRLE